MKRRKVMRRWSAGRTRTNGKPAVGLIAAFLSSVCEERASFFSGLNAVLALVNLLPAARYGVAHRQDRLRCGDRTAVGRVGADRSANVVESGGDAFPIGVILAAAFPANENGGG